MKDPLTETLTDGEVDTYNREALIKSREAGVVCAALAYTKSVRASRSIHGVADEFAHQYFEGEQGELNAALLVATDRLITARSLPTETRACPICQQLVEPIECYHDSVSNVWGHKGCVLSARAAASPKE